MYQSGGGGATTRKPNVAASPKTQKRVTKTNWAEGHPSHGASQRPHSDPLRGHKMLMVGFKGTQTHVHAHTCTCTCMHCFQTCPKATQKVTGCLQIYTKCPRLPVTYLTCPSETCGRNYKIQIVPKQHDNCVAPTGPIHNAIKRRLAYYM